MPSMRSRLAAALGASAILVAACSSGATPSPSASSAPAPSTAAGPSAAAPSGAAPSAAVAAKDAKTAAEAGGVDAVCAAGKAEGQVNIIATPPDWANYGQIITDFSAKYGIKVQSDKPDGNGQDEINAATQLAGTGRQPDIFDIGSSLVNAHTDMFTPYQVATWADIPDGNKESTGLWYNNYTGFVSIGYDTKLGDIAKVADLADAKYKGKVALNGDPLKASAGFNGVVMAALANGGSADDISAGVTFFKGLADSGNLLPVDPTPATIASGQTPIVIDWSYNNGAQTAVLAPKGITWKTVIPSDAAPVASYYNDAINKDAAHPAAARCWMEYIYYRRRPECLAEGLRPADPTRGDAEGRNTRRHGACRAQSPDDPAGPADAGAERCGNEVPHRQLEVHRHQVATQDSRTVMPA